MLLETATARRLLVAVDLSDLRSSFLVRGKQLGLLARPEECRPLVAVHVRTVRLESVDVGLEPIRSRKRNGDFEFEQLPSEGR